MRLRHCEQAIVPAPIHLLQIPHVRPRPASGGPNSPNLYAPSGVGGGQEFLSREGRILTVFQHERVHEPPGGGGSSYRRSVPLDGEMLRQSHSLLEQLRWTGVAMVEYKKDPVSGDFALMEINGRFWGSLSLAVAANLTNTDYRRISEIVRLTRDVWVVKRAQALCG